MTMDDAVRHFQWSAIHDYRKHDTVNGKIVAIYDLGLWAGDLVDLLEMVPNLKATELRRVQHDNGTWLRVDVVEEA